MGWKPAGRGSPAGGRSRVLPIALVMTLCGWGAASSHPADAGDLPGGIWGKRPVEAEALEYAVEIVTRHGIVGSSEPQKQSLRMRVYVVPQKTGAEVVYALTPVDEGAKLRGLPIGALSLDKRWTPRLELSHPRDYLFNGAVIRLFGAGSVIDEERLELQAAGQENIELTGVSFKPRIPVEYEVLISESGSEELEYLVKLSGAPVTANLGSAKLELTELDQRFTFSPDELRLTRGSWTHTILRHAGGRTFEQHESVTFTQKARRPITPEEIVQLGEEYRTLEPIARATLPGRSAKDGETDFEKQLASYKEKHPQGLMGLGLPQLERQFAAAASKLTRPANPDALADQLIGKPAPDFTLEDMDGKQVALSDFKGKVVLITFWGYI